MKADGEDSDGKDVLLLYQLRDLVNNSAMGNGTYPPCSDVMGVRAHYEAMVDEAFTIGLNDDDVSLLGIDSASTAVDAINAAVAFFEDGKGDGKGKGKGDGNGSKEWLERLLTFLMEDGWCGNNAKYIRKDEEAASTSLSPRSDDRYSGLPDHLLMRWRMRNNDGRPYPNAYGKGSQVTVMWNWDAEEDDGMLYEHVFHLLGGATTFDVKKFMLAEDGFDELHPMVMTLKNRFDEVLQNDFVINEDTTLVLELLDSYDVNVLYQPNPEQEPKEYWLHMIDGTKIVDVKKFLVGEVEGPVWVTRKSQICFATMGRSINQLHLSASDDDGHAAGLFLEDGYQINRDMTLILTIHREWSDAEVGSDVDEP